MFPTRASAAGGSPAMRTASGVGMRGGSIPSAKLRVLGWALASLRAARCAVSVSYTHLRAHETLMNL
eukprot:2021495-Prymnesium_polylepis.2